MFSKDYLFHFRRTMRIALPVCISNVGHMLVGLADTAFVGEIGKVEQAAILLASTPYFLALVFGMGVAYGITPLVSEADAKNNSEFSARVLKNGIMLNLGLGIILFLGLLFASPLFYYLNQPAEVVEKAIPYFGVLMLSLIPLSLFSACKQFAEGLSLTKTAMIITLVSNFLNIALNYIFIFGKLGVPAMGMMGAVWSTLIARIVMAAWMGAYVFYHPRFKKNHAYKVPFISGPVFSKIWKLGSGTGLQWVFEVGAFTFAAIMVGWIGVPEMASHQIALSIAAITYMVASGLSAAGSVRVGNALGRGNKTEIKLAANSVLLMGLLFMCFSALLFILFRFQATSLLSRDEGVIQIASGLLVIAAFFQISDGSQVISLGILRALKDIRVPTVITLVSYWLIGIPASWYLGFYLNMGVGGVWYGLLIGLSAAAILLYLRYRYVWKNFEPEIIAPES
jgi:multidrug resistance protein, MATE family